MAPAEFEGITMHAEGEPYYMCDVRGFLLRSEHGDLQVPNPITIWPATTTEPERAVVHTFPEHRPPVGEDAGASGRLARWLMAGAARVGLSFFEMLALRLGLNSDGCKLYRKKQVGTPERGMLTAHQVHLPCRYLFRSVKCWVTFALTEGDDSSHNFLCLDTSCGMRAMQEQLEFKPFLDPAPSAHLALEARVPGERRYLNVRMDWCCDDKATVQGFGTGGWMSRTGKPCTMCRCPKSAVHTAPIGTCHSENYESTQLDFQRDALERAQGEGEMSSAAQLSIRQAGQFASALSLSASFAFQTCKVEHAFFRSRILVPKALRALGDAIVSVQGAERTDALEAARNAFLPYRERLGTGEQKAIYLSVGNPDPLRKLETGCRKVLEVLQADDEPTTAVIVTHRNKIENLWSDARTAYYYQTGEAKGILPHHENLVGAGVWPNASQISYPPP